MRTSPLALLQMVFLLLAPEGVRPQPSSSPSGPVPISSGPGSQGGTLESSSEGPATPPAVPGTSSVFPPLGTPSAPGNGAVDLLPGEGREGGDGNYRLRAEIL